MIAYFDDKIKNIENDFEPYAEAFLTDAINQQELYDRAENNKMALYDRINDQLEKFVQKYEDKNSDIGIEQLYQQHDAKVLEDSKDNPLLEDMKRRFKDKNIIRFNITMNYLINM